METKQEEKRIAHKWMWMISAIIWFNLFIGTISAKFYKDWTWLSITSLLIVIYSLAKWYENLHSPQSKIDKQRKEEQEEHDRRMQEYNKKNPELKLQVSDNLKGSSALDKILDELEDMTPEKQEYLLDSEKRMSDEEIALYMNSKYNTDENI